MNDEDMKKYNEWLSNPMGGCSPFIVQERIVKEGEHYVLKNVVISPDDHFKERLNCLTNK